MINLNTFNNPKDAIPLCEEYGPVSLVCNKIESVLLVGTSSSDIVEFKINKKGSLSLANPTKLGTGHYKDELWGCAIHPKNKDIYVTAGDDNTVFLLLKIGSCLVSISKEDDQHSKNTKNDKSC